MSVTRKIMNITRPYWGRIFAGILLSFLVSAITGAIAWLTKPALDKILIEKQYEYLIYLPFTVFLLFLFKGILGFAQMFLMKSAGMKLIREMRNTLFDHILYLPVSYYHRESSGIVISRIMNDVKNTSQLISGVLKEFIIQVPTVIVLLGVAFSRSWQLASVSLLLLPIIAYTARKFGKNIKKKTKKAQKNVSFLTHRINEAIAGSRMIKVFNREHFMSEQFQKENQKFYRESLRAVRLRQATMIVSDTVTGAAVAFVLWFGGRMIVGGQITSGDFASILVAVYMIFAPVKKIGDAYSDLQETIASLERIETLLEAEKEDPGSVSVSGFASALKFEDVTFMYPDTTLPVLQKISLEIKKGDVLAIVGRSGMGKSTLVDLIPRFIRPTGGTVTLDGKDINEIELQSLRAQIGVVSQEVVLFNDTVRENIAFGRQGATDDEIYGAARTAFADEFIRELPQGYETVIGERGMKLSGGQRQRIAIARAVLKNPPILILDEATSSLDSVSEALVQKALDVLMKERTTIVIAHRLSTIRNADRIIVLDDGRIVDEGKHDELITRNAIYRELYQTFAAS